MRKLNATLVSALLFTLVANPALACSWASYANGPVAIVARTVDWYHSDDAVLRGCGRGLKIKAADSPTGLEYAAKYASIQVNSFGELVSDAVNEKGLQGSILYLDGSTLPPVRPDRKDMDPYKFIAYAVSNFATVREVVDNLDALNFLPKANALKDAAGRTIATKPENWPFHYALADATGDRVIIEYVNGRALVYHGKDHDTLSNEPEYLVHKTLEAFSHRPGGTISTIDRWGRARQYMKDMHERKVTGNDHALMAMRGLLASVWAGIDEIDRAENEVYPTQWGALIDQKTGRYYFSRIESWCTEIYDFSMFDPAKPESVVLKAQPCPYAPMKDSGAGKN